MTSQLQSDPTSFVEFLGAALAASDGAPVPLLALSDEEMLALEGDGHDPRFTPTPWLASLPDTSAATATMFGQRSLVLRELVTVEPGPREPSVVIGETLGEVIAARSSGVAVVRFTRELDGAVVGAFVATVHPAHGVTTEEIDLSGRHQFTLDTYRGAAASMATWALPAVPDPAGRLHGAGVPTDELPHWLGNALGATAQIIAVEEYSRGLLGGSDAAQWAVVTGDEQAVVVRPAGDEGLAEVLPTSTAGLCDLLESTFETLRRGGGIR